MNSQLWHKIMDHKEEIEQVTVNHRDATDTLFMAYGITTRSMEAALPMCRQSGRRVTGVTVHSLWPVPDLALIRAGKLNPGLYAREIRCLFPSVDIVSLQRVDGGIIKPDDFVAAWD